MSESSGLGPPPDNQMTIDGVTAAEARAAAKTETQDAARKEADRAMADDFCRLQELIQLESRLTDDSKRLYEDSMKIRARIVAALEWGGHSYGGFPRR